MLLPGQRAMGEWGLGEEEKCASRRIINDQKMYNVVEECHCR